MTNRKPHDDNTGADAPAGEAPFFERLRAYVEAENIPFDCPGHQGGAFYERHPVGRTFREFLGENVFRADLCNADVDLGDLLIHEGAPLLAQQAAARVFNADKTYFVLNGTSASNKVVLNALLTPGDFVLFDRNNHKSNHHGALLQAGATPVYLETSRNPYGFIGGIPGKAYDEAALRAEVAKHDPVKAASERPFRLAVIQLGTYDGTIYDARRVLDRIGRLCDYVLFDSAWVGYEAFIPMIEKCSPLRLELGPEDPGIFVTQSVHKQQAGFSQASQIHKKDAHIKGQKRYCPHKVVNNAFMMHASTSPFYPLFASLDVNQAIHADGAGERMWDECVRTGIAARKAILERCRFIRPFVPETVHGRPWRDVADDELMKDAAGFTFEPGAAWHGFEGYEEGQYYVDPCKLLLTTPGLDPATGRYTEEGLPAAILARYLRERGIIPEKSDLNSILFLLTPAETTEKMNRLVDELAAFEASLEADAPLREVLPALVGAHPERYAGMTILDLAAEYHGFCRRHALKDLQKAMFTREGLPEMRMLPKDAHNAYLRAQSEYVPLSEARDRVALEGALPYPPGVLCCVPGEVWGGAVLDYFLALEEGLDLFPGFAPELQGVYVEETPEGRRVMVNVLEKED